MKDAGPLNDDSLLTLNDLAKHMQVTSRTVQRMVSEGECPPPFRVGGAVRWRWATIREWIRLTEIRQSMVTIDDNRRHSTTSSTAGRKGTSEDSEPK